MKQLFSIALVASLLSAPAVMAKQVSFDNSWKEQKFSLFSKNKYSFKGSTLGVASDGAVSMAYRAVPESLWGGQQSQLEMERGSIRASDRSAQKGR
ncbi:hypothetical protein [Planktotalea sp.]|uniref:hypothetical protein n=1 Tax=Planktotalea sp. TaxID=2029877 RepID=UPI0035C873B3